MPCECALGAYLGLVQLVGRSPRIVTFDFQRWENASWGIHDIYRTQGSATVAVSSDGSRSNRASADMFKHYFVPTDHWTIHNIYRRPDNTAYYIDDQAKTATFVHCGCTWEERKFPPPDGQCRAIARSYLDSEARVGTGVVAGVLVIRYSKSDGDSEAEAAFAPQYDCELLEWTQVTRNEIGLPTAWFHFIVRSYVPGEPRWDLFLPPNGYTVLERSR